MFLQTIGEDDVQQTLQVSFTKNLFYEKQFGFQASNSTEHAVIQLISQILDVFNENKYTLGIFIDLSKVFDTGIS